MIFLCRICSVKITKTDFKHSPASHIKKHYTPFKIIYNHDTSAEELNFKPRKLETLIAISMKVETVK